MGACRMNPMEKMDEIVRALEAYSGRDFEYCQCGVCRALTLARELQDSLASLEGAVGLHESVEVAYVVDGYEATLTIHDGASTRASAEGATILAALEALALRITEPTP